MSKKSEYSELLKDPRWQKKRLEIFERDGWACRICGNAESMLAVHHLEYASGKKPWEYENVGLVTLCSSCHEDERDRAEIEHRLLRYLRFALISAPDLNDFMCAVDDAIGNSGGQEPGAVFEIIIDLLFTPEFLFCEVQPALDPSKRSNDGGGLDSNTEGTQR